MRLKIDWVSLIVGSKFTVFALFYFIFAGKFPITNPRRGFIYLEGRFNGRFFALLDWGGLYLEGLIFGILRYNKGRKRQKDILYCVPVKLIITHYLIMGLINYVSVNKSKLRFILSL